MAGHSTLSHFPPLSHPYYVGELHQQSSHLICPAFSTPADILRCPFAVPSPKAQKCRPPGGPIEPFTPQS